jgi:hypothetical protein
MRRRRVYFSGHAAQLEKWENQALGRVEWYESHLNKCRADLEAWQKRDPDPSSPADRTLEKYIGDLREILAFHQSQAKYWGQRKLVYERAARYPWLSMPPDPPEPE